MENNLNPWDYQRRLMQISGQSIPSTPTLTPTSLLYLALQMEEFGEQLQAVWLAMLTNGCVLPVDDINHFRAVAEEFGTLGASLQRQSKALRGKLIRMDFKMPLHVDAAVEILDGTTDLAVVNCGFAIATGLPGAEAYEEVVTSNISKQNPETGRIDKHPDGKWIKGTGFFKPDLARVLKRMS